MVKSEDLFLFSEIWKCGIPKRKNISKCIGTFLININNYSETEDRHQYPEEQ